MTRFLVDNQLPVSLVHWLRARDYEADHVLDLSLGQSSDTLIWQRAATAGSVIITKDEDFAQLTILRPEPVCVIWLRVGNCRTKALLTALERVWPEVIRQLGGGARLIEVY